ncbi:hypothetical protein Fot_19817 [Forsythia ovata]|uniref:Uncharacterized protein n=1 Tax=Forsythia ovata TaxID=205694 RepID=A0ABD1VM62_9LAMI
MQKEKIIFLFSFKRQVNGISLAKAAHFSFSFISPLVQTTLLVVTRERQSKNFLNPKEDSDLEEIWETALGEIVVMAEPPLKWTAVCILGLSSLPKIGLAGLASKKIPPVVKKKSSDNDQKRTFAGLSLKGGEKDQDVPTVPFDMRQTVLVPSASP